MDSKRKPLLAKIGLVAVAALSIVAGLQCAPSGKFSTRKDAPLITAEPKPRFVRGPHAKERWSWPAMGHFDSTLADVRRDVEPIRLVRGKLIKDMAGERTEYEDVVFSIAKEPGGETYELEVELARDDDERREARLWPYRGFRLETGPLSEAEEGVPLVFSRGTARVRLEPTYVSAANQMALDAVDAWAYVAALLASDPPVYDSNAEDGYREGEILKARAAGDWEGLLSIYRSWRPMGRCSMDDRPAEVAREYAELCYDVGKLGCFLQLQLRIMSNAFDRVAYSSYGEAAAETQADRLVETGLDVDEFFLGLAVHFGNVDRLGEIGPWRLARSIKESGRAESITARLGEWANDPHLDELNRLRVVQILYLLQEDGLVDESRLGEIGRMWLAQARANEEKDD